MIVLLLLGCPKHEPAALFPEPLPELTPPAREVIEPEAGACGFGVLVIGELVPEVYDGRAVCTGQIIPTAEALELAQDGTDATWWAAQANTCHTYRGTDRGYAQTAYTDQADRLGECHTDLRIQSAATPAAFVAGTITGLLIGAGFGYGVAQLP